MLNIINKTIEKHEKKIKLKAYLADYNLWKSSKSLKDKREACVTLLYLFKKCDIVILDTISIKKKFNFFTLKEKLVLPTSISGNSLLTNTDAVAMILKKINSVIM